METARFYVTTYCNYPHRLKDGKPIEHECYVIPPTALQAEIAGDYRLACDIIQANKTHNEWNHRNLLRHRGTR